jgi:hypothetical protein
VRIPPLRHRFPWCVAIQVAAGLVCRLIGVPPILSLVPYFAAWTLLPWADPPMEWRSMCYRAGCWHLSKQDELWGTVLGTGRAMVGVAEGTGDELPVGTEITVGPVDGRICGIVHTRRGWVFSWAAGPPRQRGQRKRQREKAKPSAERPLLPQVV